MGFFGHGIAPDPIHPQRVCVFEKRGHQAWITLNRPESKNTLNGAMFVELADAWQEVRDDPAIRVAVVTANLVGRDLGTVSAEIAAVELTLE